MKHRNILFYIVLYMAVCVSWALYARYHLLMPIDSWINLASILLHLSFFHALYICLVQMPTRAFTLRSFWPALPVVLISLSVLEKTYVIVLVLLGALILSLFLCQLFHRRERIHWFSWILVLLSAAAYGFSYRVIPAILILVALVYDTYRRYGYKKIDQLSLLPTSQENQMKAIPLLIVFLTVVFYLMEFSVMEINIVFHVIVISYSLFLLLNMETLSTPYEDVESLYLLVSYVGQEREAFSRLIHDEMIQDIRASKNALILKEVDIPLAVEILTNLEEKSRKMMNYYSQHIFEDYTVEENIHNLLAAIQALYPQQNISMKIEMDDTLGKCDQKMYRMVMQIAKELINNVFKHSHASYLHFAMAREGDRGLSVILENDGVTAEDVQKMESSRGGLLLLKVLIREHAGRIEHVFEDGVLRTTIHLNSEG